MCAQHTLSWLKFQPCSTDAVKNLAEIVEAACKSASHYDNAVKVECGGCVT